MNHLLIELIEAADSQTSLLDQEERVTAKELVPLIPELSDRELISLWEEAERTAALARRVRDAVGERVNDQVRLPVRDGERYYTFSGYKTTKVIDPAALIEYIGDRWPEVIAIERVRVTALDKVAEDKGDQPQTVRNTFLDTNWQGTERLRAAPLDKAPKRMRINALGDDA